MRIVLCLSLVSVINNVACFTSDLSHDLDDIATLLPSAQDLFPILDAGTFDPQSQNASNYVASADFVNAMYLATKHPDLAKIKNYLNSNNIDVNKLFLKIIKMLENNPQTSYEPFDMYLQSFVDRIYNEPQLDNIISLVIHKIATRESFRFFYKLLNNLNYYHVYTEILDTPSVREMLINLNNLGINTNEVWKAMSYLFGWDKPTAIIPFKESAIEEEIPDPEESSLFKIFRQYLNLIPKEKFIILYRGLLANPLFQNILTYIYNRNYHEVVEKFNTGVIGKFFGYINERGVCFKKFLDLISDHLGLDYAYYRIPSDDTEVITNSISMHRFFELAKLLLPMHEIKKLTASLLTFDEEYEIFHEKVHDLFQDDNVDLFLKNQFEYEKTAIQYGFSVKKIMSFVFLLVGVESKVQTEGIGFTENLYKFVELLPRNSYIDLYHKYKNDTNIWRIITYLKGPDFLDFIEYFFATVELNSSIHYMIKQFIPVKALLIDILDNLGIMQWWVNYEFYCKHDVTCTGRTNYNSDNLYNFIQERINLFPLREMQSLFQCKLKDNPYIINLYRLVANLDGVKLFQEIIENYELRSFFMKFVKLGYNFRNIVQQISQMFGWGNVLTMDLPLNKTKENFEEFIDNKSLFKILGRYPDEVQRIKEFFKNDAFANALNIFVNEPPVRHIITWMEKFNVSVIDYINYYSGQDSPNVFHLALNTKLKWKDFITDIVKFLSDNKFFEFCVAQKNLSIEFNALLEKFLIFDLNITTLLGEFPDFLYVINNINAMGINLKDVSDFIEDVESELY